jgi:hypothetical protein
MIKVFYLDNIEFGVNIVADYIFPRASVFSQEIVDKLITMDSKTNVHNKKSLYGNHEVASAAQFPLYFVKYNFF